ncbi:HlyD family type I secretion membrane fusion protein [Bradyrhizobium sp. F1.13.1]
MSTANQPVQAKGDFRRYAMLGYVSIALVFGAFGIWASIAPLDRAAVAPGQVAVSGDHKVVQHLEGGIIREILAKETQHVKQGDVLFRLQPTEAQANTDILRKQMDVALAEQARLVAEQTNAPSIEFPDSVVARSQVPETAMAIADQQRQFREHRATLVNQVNILKSQIAQQQQELAGRDRQRAALSDQLTSYVTQMNNVKPLLEKGFYPRNKYLEMDRERARLEGDLGQAQADVSRLGQTIEQTGLQIDQAQQKFQNDISQQLDVTRAKLSDVREKLLIAEDVLRRIDVRAERDGIVMNMKIHTVGAVVRPGDTLAEIVPVGEGVDVMAHVSPRDIETVAIGQRAEVRFPNFSSRATAIILGRVQSVSADAITDDATKQTYYSARIVIDYSTLPPEMADHILPGMQADVLISTGERTVLQYLAGPLVNAMSKTFREK